MLMFGCAMGRICTTNLAIEINTDCICPDDSEYVIFGTNYFVCFYQVENSSVCDNNAIMDISEAKSCVCPPSMNRIVIKTSIGTSKTNHRFLCIDPNMCPEHYVFFDENCECPIKNSKLSATNGGYTCLGADKICPHDTFIPLDFSCVCPFTQKKFTPPNGFICNYDGLDIYTNDVYTHFTNCVGNYEDVCRGDPENLYPAHRSGKKCVTESGKHIGPGVCPSLFRQKCYEFDNSYPKCIYGFTCTYKGCGLTYADTGCFDEGISLALEGLCSDVVMSICKADHECSSGLCNFADGKRYGECYRNNLEHCDFDYQCLTNVCNLAEKFQKAGKLCVVDYNNPCNSSDECIIGTVCSNGICKKKIYESCDHNDECGDITFDKYTTNLKCGTNFKCILCENNESYVQKSIRVKNGNHDINTHICVNQKDHPTGKIKCKCENGIPIPQDACFPVTANFTTLINNQEVIITGKDLEHNMLIKTGPSQYEPILFFGHFDTHIDTTMLQFNQHFTVSYGHYVYISPVDKIPAHQLKLNDRLLTPTGYITITNISTIRTVGLINPHTYSGRIVVDGVIASCYTEHFNPDIAHFLTILTYYIPGWIKTMVLKNFL